MRYSAGSHVGYGAKEPNGAIRYIVVLVQSLQPNRADERKLATATRCLQTPVAPEHFSSSGSEMPKSTGSWCKYLKIRVDSEEKKGSVAITLPPDFNLLAARFRNAIGLFR